MSELTDDEIKQFIRNEEKLWDMAAITIASSLVAKTHWDSAHAQVAVSSYDYATALIVERKRRLLGDPNTP